ncbi:MAG TPA: peptidoglycan DD-metalloendopeptidase family protein [Clostridiales bacterium]|nr:peptidoglycan DD-metalloendopeptidase family protein [Clostridiales bacterium]
MEPERLEDDGKEKDVFQRNAIIKKMQEVYKEIEYNFSKSMIKLGTCITRTLMLGIKKIKKMLGGVGGWFKNKGLVVMDKVGDFVVDLIKKLASPIANRKQCAEDIRINLNIAKKLGKKAFIKEIFKSFGRFYSGAGGILSTAFNYVAPVVSVAFLIGIVNCVSGLEYGLSVQYNGEEMGIVNEETDFDEATKEVQKRIAQVDGGTELEFTPRYSLKVINNNDEYVNSGQLADKMLSSSDAELIEAFGVYVDDEFIGAVTNKEAIAQELTNMLANCDTSGSATVIKFQKQVDYVKGIYLTDSLTKEDDLTKKLQSTRTEDSTYTVAENDTPIVIAQKCNMSLEDLTPLNPELINSCVTGDILKIKKTVSYMPIEYTRVLQTTDYIDYGSVEVETNTIYKGQKAVLTKGVRGEQTNVENVYYVDGMEISREVISSQITKEPVTEEIGVGTYTAKPSSSSSSTALVGNGQFSWPVNGGYISDTFGSNRNHKGIDIAAPSGTAIYAAADGVVIYSGWDSGGYGNCIRIDHGNGYVTVYAHNSSMSVSVGQTVTRGEYIGGVGTTGDSSGNHCHFEVRCNGIPYNPANYISVNN